MLDSSFARGVSTPSSLDFSLFSFFLFSFPSSFYNPSIYLFTFHLFFDDRLVFSLFPLLFPFYFLSISFLFPFYFLSISFLFPFYFLFFFPLFPSCLTYEKDTIHLYT
ncbi:hypothetical protein M431DRAFT_437747 [Trichoderma harzianum CBS 226.95]|uniref:Uncharacterized protein n=1 Tax=Trichoderma harzianum CBS 226.95 TaxID=983964 RepID=A0A2T4ADF3_TRIHA|nr:hypothetical protein M431DRAFT_437747 [Trichoderma harzianum CBS 226.95]PTB55117.1 hypothetical protein M431DRAFT_437747 [Trichoderma harzianum CBS 226.95]